ncbi:MAG: chromosome segregation protein SMC, partial [Limisphaerales bacterium]
ERTEQLREQIEGLSQSVLTGESEIAQLRERLSELEQEISQAQQQGLQLKSEADRHESRIHFNDERLRELAQQNAQATTEIAQADERKLAAEQELAQVTQRLATSTETLKELQATLESRRQALVAVEAEARAQQESLRRAQQDALQAGQQLARVRNEITALDLQKEGNAVRLQKLSAEKVQLEQERVGLEERLKEFSANFEVEMLNAQTHRGTVQEREQRLKQIDQELNAANRQLQDFLRLQAEKRSRLNVLEQLQNDHEGFSSGALSALRNAQQVLGSLADKIRVPNDYVVAIESALGHHLQLVLTQAPESAQQIIDDLRTNKKGRASIAAVDLVSQVSEPAVSPVSKPADRATLPTGSSLALDVVECDAPIRPLLERLLGNTLIVDDLAAATAAWKQTNGAFNFVTRTGDLLNSSGIFTGGAGGNDKGASASILGRKNQIAELQQAADQIQEQVNEASKTKGSLLSEQTQLQASLHEAKTELHTQEVAIATRKGEFNALQNSQRTLEQKVQTVVYEITSLAAQEEEGLRKRQALADRVGALEEQERTAQESVHNLTAALEGLRQQRDAATTAMTETKVAFASEEQLLASLRNQQKPLESRITELAHLSEQRRNEIRAFIDRKAQADRENIQSRHAIEALQQQREQVNNQVADLIANKDTQEEQIATAEEALREQRRCLTEYQQQRGAIEVELAQKNMAAQNLRDRMQEKYQINLDEVRSECITITIADEGQPRVSTMSPEEMAATGAATDWDAVTQQVADLQRKLDEMGPVNLVAIDEYEETEQRYQFLT